MYIKVDNDYGSIAVNEDVIAKIAAKAASECEGIICMAVKNVKDGFVHLLKVESIAKGVRVKENEIDVHVVVSYGCNIAKAAGEVIGKVKYMVEEQTGIEIENVNVFVDGIRKVTKENKD